MKALAIGAAAAALSLGVAAAQTTPPSQSSTTMPATTAPRTGAATTGAATTGAPTPGTAATGTTAGTNGTAAASGNDNQAVATTNANAPQPAKGHNSFTRGQAQTRIQRHGFTKVSGLKLDGNGVWRGTAQQNGQSVNVWLDYKGNVGSGQQ